MKISLLVFGASLLGQGYSAACPYAVLKRAGLLSEEDAAKFDAVERDANAAEDLFQEHHREVASKREAEPQLIGPTGLGGLLDLPLGGGLLNGVLQPLSGLLAGIDIPTPQSQGAVLIPGDDPLHQFQAPGPTDVRGICPTLNALANHGYISRDGVRVPELVLISEKATNPEKITSFAEAANAVQTGYGFTYGLSVFLSALGLLAGGDLVTGKYTIGGVDPRVPNTLGPALGLDKHGVFEIDGSITREDVYFGNNANFLLQRWKEYVNISQKYDGLFDQSTNAEDNGLRYDNSRATNPDFFAGAIWFAVSHAERVFVYQGLANGTTEGVADYANVAPFFLNETFPPYWYRRSDPFPLPAAFGDALAMFLENPRELGANEGSVDNFVPLSTNISAFTPAEPGCFVLENSFDLAPGQLSAVVYDNLDLYQSFIKGIVAPFFIDDGFFNCNLTSFVTPSANAGVKGGSVSSSGSPVNGAYPGIGVIAPDSQPS